MNTIGIIAEYNPFHKGHLYHLNESVKMVNTDTVVAVMSGNFTQRGEPAIYDKWIRAEMAVKNGVDLVLELPFVFACNNAEFFAYGAMNILNSLGCITHFSFGSESGHMTGLMDAADLLTHEEPDFKDRLKKHLAEGLSFPRARYETVKEIKGAETAALIREPNNILSVEYLKQWIRMGSHMQPITIMRSGKGYHDSDISHPLASARAIRNKMSQPGDFELVLKAIPEETAEIMQRTGLIPVTGSEELVKLLAYKVLTTPAEELAHILSAGEGLENKLKKAIIKNNSTEEVIDYLLSKRYTETRIKRLLIHTLTGLTKSGFFGIMENPHLYARVLGFSSNGAKLLRHIKSQERNKIPIISNINKELRPGDPVWDILKYDILASDIYNLLYLNDLYKRSDHVCSPFFGEK
ncbi:nucleotidyltransferase [Bacillota bacterium]